MRRIGICLHLNRLDSTIVACQVAKLAKGLGNDVEIFALSGSNLDIIDSLKKNVVPFKLNKKDFKNWISGLTHLVSASPLPNSFMEEINQAGVKSHLILDYADLAESHLDTIKEFDNIVCPDDYSLKLFKEQTAILNVLKIAPDLDIPLSVERRNYPRNVLQIVWPVHNQQILRQNLDFSLTVAELLKKYKNIKFLILYTTSLGRETNKVLTSLAEESMQRLEIKCVKDFHAAKINVIIGRQDLVVWPALFDGMGLVGLEALSMGVPVVAYKLPPASELVANMVNGVLVSADFAFNWFGVPIVSSNYADFNKAIEELIKNQHLLQSMKEKAHLNLAERRQLFKAAWASLLD